LFCGLDNRRRRRAKTESEIEAKSEWPVSIDCPDLGVRHPVLDYPTKIRMVIYTTNAVEIE